MNAHTIKRFGRLDDDDYSQPTRDRIAKAIADEVAYGLDLDHATGSGVGWYSHKLPTGTGQPFGQVP